MTQIAESLLHVAAGRNLDEISSHLTNNFTNANHTSLGNNSILFLKVQCIQSRVGITMQREVAFQ